MYRLLYLLACLLAVSAGLYLGLPWWTPAIFTAVLAVLFPVWRRGGFWFAFVAGFLTWGIYTGYLHVDSEGRLTDRLAVTFGVVSGWNMVLITACWGGLTAGLGGWFGASLRRAFWREAKVVTDA